MKASLDIKLTDNKELIKNATAAQIRQALEAIGIEAESNAKQEITKAVYDTLESPNYRRTGRLRNSITHITKSEEKSVYIGSNVNDAQYVELGTSRMPPRPFIRPAVTEDKYVRRYKELVEMALKSDGTD